MLWIANEKLREKYVYITDIGISAQAYVIQTRTYLALEVFTPVSLSGSSVVKMEATNSIETFVLIH